MCLAIVVVGVLLAAPGVDGTWSGGAAMVGQSAVYVTASIVTGVALRRHPACLGAGDRRQLCAADGVGRARSRSPSSPSVAPWMDFSPGFDGMSGNVLSTTQWAHAGTSLAIWMVLPLLIGAWRITRREIAS